MLILVESTRDESDDEADDSGYLHPSLLSKSASTQPIGESASTIPQFTPSQLENTSYGRLLKKISDKLPTITNSPQRNVTPTYR